MGLFLLVTIKLLIGFFAMVIIINISGKGNLAPNSASDQVQNYVLGGIIGSVELWEALFTTVVCEYLILLLFCAFCASLFYR